MTKEDNIFGAFLEYPLALLEHVPTYEYIKNLNVFLKSCSSAVDCTFGCGMLGHLVLTAHPAVFNTYCGTAFVTPKNLGIFRSCPTQLQRPRFCQNSSERTNTKFVYLTNITQSIVRAQNSSSSWSGRNSTSASRAVLLDLRRPQASRLLLTSSP